MSQLIVTHTDMRSAGYCNRSARIWFSRRGLDWAQFRREGLPIEILERTGDAQVLRWCQRVRDGR